ncbi:MAG: hypothetical protein HFH47_02340 [Bacilli bacterium]|nr:hypothetical protein [Bacilli bacterium]
MINLVDLMGIIFYMSLIVLIIFLIVLVIRAIKTLGKVDKTLDDIQEKSSKLDGVFHIIDNTTDVVVGISDTIISFVAGSIENLVNRKKVKKDE